MKHIYPRHHRLARSLAIPTHRGLVVLAALAAVAAVVPASAATPMEPGVSRAAWNAATATSGATALGDALVPSIDIRSLPAALAQRAGADIARKAGVCTTLPAPDLPNVLTRSDGTTLTLANRSQLKPGWSCTGPYTGAPAYKIVASSIRVGIPSPHFTGSSACPTVGADHLPCYQSEAAATVPPPGGPCGPTNGVNSTAVVDIKTLMACLGVGDPQPPHVFDYVPDLGLGEHSNHTHPLPVNVPEQYDAVYYNSAGQLVGSWSSYSYNLTTTQVSSPGAGFVGNGNAPMANSQPGSASGKDYPCVYDTSSSRVYERDSYPIYAHGDGRDANGGQDFLHSYNIHVYEADHARPYPNYSQHWSWQVEICGTGTATNVNGAVFMTGLSVAMDDSNASVHLGLNVPQGATESHTPSDLSFNLDIGPVGVHSAVSNSAGAKMWGGWGKNCAWPKTGYGPNAFPVNEASDCWDATSSSEKYNAGSAESNALYEYDEKCNCEAYYDAMAASEYDGDRGTSYWAH